MLMLSIYLVSIRTIVPCSVYRALSSPSCHSEWSIVAIVQSMDGDVSFKVFGARFGYDWRRRLQN
ncbi:hypothetical protein GCM10010917_37410 [Paenibacillus physcomitrellae]|uniref:Secreted protein n=1 Tax=Paenibacillus physcomitrellae TaxID=1619311 RepID=A0ABQ1GQW6_9BACL|nr:hypothetical protein GCM10010917_37410 [Paenibacillus physcomitrellae]